MVSDEGLSIAAMHRICKKTGAERVSESSSKDGQSAPKCGIEVSSPKKRWTMAGRPDKTGKRMQIEIGLFDCPKCKKPFRVALSKQKV